MTPTLSAVVGVSSTPLLSERQVEALLTLAKEESTPTTAKHHVHWSTYSADQAQIFH
jgi:hypothetical protein